MRSPGRSGRQSCRNGMQAMSELLDGPVCPAPVNVRALLDRSAHVMRVRARAPLRISFAGGGTDLASYADTFGGCVLNATIGMFAYSSIELRDDHKVRFAALDHEQECRCDSDAVEASSWPACHACGGASPDRQAISRWSMPAGDSDDEFRRAARFRAWFVVDPGCGDHRGGVRELLALPLGNATLRTSRIRSSGWIWGRQAADRTSMRQRLAA